MKKILKISLLAIIFYLCIVPYQCTKAENETEQNSQKEAEISTNTEIDQTEENEKEPTETNTSEENQKQEEGENTPTEPTPSTNQNSTVEPREQSKEEVKQSESQKKSPTKTPATISPKAKESSNANLANLGMTPNDFKGFRPGILDYNVTVPNDVEKVNVYAKVQDAKAQIVSGTGEQNLNIGNNSLQVVVTAENGATQTYTINVTREETTNEEVEKPEEKKDNDLKKIEIKGYQLTPSFSADIYEYKLDVKQDVTELEIVTEGQNDKVSIEVVGNTDLKERRKYNYYFSKK